MAKSITTIWVLAELLAYILIFSRFPALYALLIGVVSTVLGALTLRFIGQRLTAQASADFITVLSGKDLRSLPLALIGALLLLLPGFLTDAIGLLLVIAGVRSLFRTPPVENRMEREIDLSRDQWTRLPDDEKPR